MTPKNPPPPPNEGRERAITGMGYMAEGRLERAQTEFARSLLYDQAGDDLASQARDHQNLAALAARRADYDAALDHLDRALALSKQAGRTEGQAKVLGQAKLLGMMALILDAKGDVDLAGKVIDEALGQAAGDEPRHYLLNVKAAHEIRKESWDSAESALKEAAALSTADPGLAAGTRHYQARCLLARGDSGGAREVLAQALDLDRTGGRTEGIAADLDLLGDIEAAGKSPEAAFDAYERALGLYVALSDGVGARRVIAKLETLASAGGLSGYRGRALTKLSESVKALEAKETTGAGKN